MLTLFRKKKIKESVVANMYVNTLLNTIEDGFPSIAELINEAPEFKYSPQLSIDNDDIFTLIIIAANLNYIPLHLKEYQDERMMKLILQQLSTALNADVDQLTQVIKTYQAYLAKINAPSKKTLYAMSKAIFGKYQLNQFQDSYFKNLNSPNPMFLKKLDEVMDNFLWNWEVFIKKNQLVS